MHAISSYRGNRRTNKHTQRETGPITTHCAAKLSARSAMNNINHYNNAADIVCLQQNMHTTAMLRNAY